MHGLGVGARFKDIYTYASYTPRLEFRNMFTVSMSYRVGETRRMKEKIIIKRLFETAYKLYEHEQYDEAEAVLDKILEFDQENEMAKNLKELIKSQRSIGRTD